MQSTDFIVSSAIFFVNFCYKILNSA